MVLPGDLDPRRAPAPLTPAERVVFAHLYQTLVEVACDGSVQPALAGSWKADEGGRLWTFTLRPGLRDWEGGGVTATQVAEIWLALQEGVSGAPRASAVARSIARLTALDLLTLRVEMRAPVGATFFARPELAVQTRVGDAEWPMGTGAFRPAEWSNRSRPDMPLRLTGPTDLVVGSPGPDARDELDRGVDLLVTSDPRVVEYARATADFDAIPLAWERTYLLLTREQTASSSSLVAGASPETSGPLVRITPEAISSALARNAVRGEARGATPIPGDCPAPTLDAGLGVATAAGATEPRVVYPTADPVARSLAERLVALAQGGGGAEAVWFREAFPGFMARARPGAVGLGEAAFREALRRGGDAAYLVSVEREPHGGGCPELERAAALAPWLLASASEPEGLARATVMSLVETRPTLLLRRGLGGLALDGRGVLRLEGLRRIEGGPR